MAQHTDNPNPSPESLERGYEVGDLNIRAAAWFLPIFAVFIVITLVFLWIVQYRMLREPEVNDRKRSVIDEPQRLTNAPPLQPMQGLPPKAEGQKSETDYLPSEDLVRMYHKENKHFEALGWKVDSRTIQPDPPKPPDALIEQVIARVNSRRSTTTTPAAEDQRPTANTVTPIPQRDQGGKP
jgi:hypothetical protein